jgi:hypothetical protein
MFREIVQTIDNSQIYSIVGMLLFFGAFAAIVFAVVRMDKAHVDRMSRLPIETNRQEREESHG